MNEKNNLILATALLAAFVGSSAHAMTEREALLKLDGGITGNTTAKVEARDQLGELVKAGVPVDHAYEVISSAVNKNYSPRELRKISSEIQEQVKDGIPAEHVAKTADNAIDAGYSAKNTKKILQSFEKRVEKGMVPNEAYMLSSNEVSLKTKVKNKGNSFGTDAEIRMDGK